MATFHSSVQRHPVAREALMILTRVSIVCSSISLSNVVGTKSTSQDLLVMDFITDIMSSANTGSSLLFLM